MHQILTSVTDSLDRFSRFNGRVFSWLALFLVVAMVLRLIISHLLPADSWLGGQVIKVSESVNWMHAILFLMAAAYTLNLDEHVRVDIFYRKMSQRQRAWVDLSGVIFLLWPFCGLVLWACWRFVGLSWKIGEVSPEPDGLPGLYLLKSFLLVMAALLFIEGLNLLLKKVNELFFTESVQESN